MPYMFPTRLAAGSYFPETSPTADGQVEAVDEFQQAAPPKVPGTIKIPLNGDELEELSQQEYNLDQSAAITLGFAVSTLEASVKHELLVFQVARYKDVADRNDTFRFGVAIEATITVTTEKFQGSLSLPVVAANVQLSNASASSNLAVRGYLPQSALHLPAWGSFDVGSYTDFQNTVSKLQDEILFDNKNIRPVLLATTKTVSGATPIQAQPPHVRFYDNLFKHRNSGTNVPQDS